VDDGLPARCRFTCRPRRVDGGRWPGDEAVSVLWGELEGGVNRGEVRRAVSRVRRRAQFPYPAGDIRKLQANITLLLNVVFLVWHLDRQKLASLTASRAIRDNSYASSRSADSERSVGTD